MKCINLRERFGKRYRIQHEESYRAERPEFRAAEEVWLQIIPCRHGHIYPAGGELLAVSTDRRGAIAKRIRELPFVEVVQDGEDGINATFPVDQFKIVAAIVRPQRRRQLTPEQRQAATERLRRFQFPAARQQSFWGPGTSADDRGRPNTPCRVNVAF